MIEKEEFIKIWNEYIEPLFEDGTLEWECSSRLSEYLINCGNWEYSDDEIIELVNSEKL